MKPLTVRLPDDLHEQLRRLAFDKRVSMNELVIKALLTAFTPRAEFLRLLEDEGIIQKEQKP